VLALTILGILLDIKDVEKTFTAVTTATLYTFLKVLIFLIIVVIVYRIIKKITTKENLIEQQLSSLLKVLKGKESLFAIFFVFILLFASLTEAVGLHFIIGSFFASMLISEELVGKDHLDTFHKTTNSMAMGFLAPIFFAGIGLEFKFSSISGATSDGQGYYLLLAIIGVSFLSKIVGGYVGGRLAGLPHRYSATLGIGLNARGIMELVIANIAYREKLIGPEIFSMLVIMGLITTLSTPFMLKRSFRWMEKLP
jgi:Kef-type K+ transport system membrane component KefB